ncbi:phosphoribosylformylglycinamidine synthase [Mycoplasmatota bacterium WC30]
MIDKRIFVERKIGYEVEREHMIKQIKDFFDIDLRTLRYFVTYDIFNIEAKTFEIAKQDVLSEANRDNVFDEIVYAKTVIAIESLPGQFNQRAESAIQCVKLINPASNVIITSGYLFMFDETITDDNLQKLKKFYINKVEAREKDLSILKQAKSTKAKAVLVIDGFIDLDEESLKIFYEENNLAMTFDDLVFIQNYFKSEEKRNPYETEIKVLDTYWSDHCRHTTFETMIEDVVFEKGKISEMIEKTFTEYIETRNRLGIKKPVTLMDIAIINSKLERKNGNLDDLEISDEVNACSIYIDVDVEGEIQRWLLMFKNETHNHPTEIEPFGGASTCIGGAIRDPLSGRSYVYGAMRITGAADITKPLSETLEGKLPQRIISKVAANGYSSYGNQIGIPTTYVNEIFHEGFLAKRLEVGAVIGAVKADNIKREKPVNGDVIVLLGGRTGRDGIGGATGSSKTHNEKSLSEASTEVQKGNAPEERKIQKLFRNPVVTKLIKKSNDFGAGGVCVAIGELADGINIDLDKIPVKYQGINGTELAISESQERMAVVIDCGDRDEFISLCHEENIEAEVIAEVTNTNRLVMQWQGKTICDISRDFIETSGVRQTARVEVVEPKKLVPFNKDYQGISLKEKLLNMLQDHNVASLQGLSEMFDSSIGRTTVLSPYGGKYKTTKTFASVQKIPVIGKNTNTVSIMAYGYNPKISKWSPYHGATYAIIDSIAKVVASGGDYQKIRFTFQEYFEKLMRDPKKWAKPMSALLGAYNTLKNFNLAAIGGKDSMSGTFHEINVPPTLISFAVATDDVSNIISPEFKAASNYLYLFKYDVDEFYLPNIKTLKSNFSYIKNLISKKVIISASPILEGGLSEALIKSTFGNKIGVSVETNQSLFDYNYGAILVESNEPIEYKEAIYLGKTNNQKMININGTKLGIDESLKANESTFREIYPITTEDSKVHINTKSEEKVHTFSREKVEEVIVVNPVFPGTNCEYDTESVFIREGAKVITFTFKNLTEEDINKSIDEFTELLGKAHILMLSGGFSSGDEPDGSGKFIASVLKNAKVAEAIEKFLKKKNLILGICNGFQALVKSGLLPYGKISPLQDGYPTLFKNDINRHIAKFTDTKVSSLNSPWLTSFKLNERHTIPMSHGEGKFIINEAEYQELINNNQIAFQYVDDLNQPTSNPNYNINGSSYAIEGIISKNGLILGKMGHSERYEAGLFKNISGNLNQNIFKNAIKYFQTGGLK